MSIYATLWSLKFPNFGQDYFGCEWVAVIAQGVPLLVLTGEEYAKITFEELHTRICDPLRGNRPRHP
jgi:hypothetical protein